MNLNFNKYISIFAIVMIALPVLADQAGLLRTDSNSLAPMETLNITVIDVNATCTINVTTPTGYVQSFGGTIVDGNCIAQYKPSYLLGLYEVNAVADGNATETDIFTVTVDDWGGSIDLVNWQADISEYLPGEPVTLTADINDGNGLPLASFSNTFSDILPNYTRGAMSIQRKIIGIDSSGNLIARLYIYFDTTGPTNILGNNYARIYSGTQVKIKLHDAEGDDPVDPTITIIEGFENNNDNALDSSLVANLWTVTVNSTIFQHEKYAYLDFYIPQAKSLSDVTFSVDYIKYNHDSGIGDRIYIANTYVSEGAFPAGYEFTTGYSFTGLGRFPVTLPLNPSHNGLIYYHVNYDTLPSHTLNNGTINSTNGTYTNEWSWKRVADEDAGITFYADKYGYSHAYGLPIPVTLESATRDNIHILNYNLDKLVYTEGETRQLNAELKDEFANPVTGFRKIESVTGSDKGKLSIVSRNIATDANGNNVFRLLLYFDTTGKWSNIYANTQIEFSFYGPDGKTGIDPNITITDGNSNATGYIASTLTDSNGIYSWTVTVTTNFTGADRQIWLDFSIPPEHSASEVIYAVNRIYYRPNMEGSWPDSINIKTTTLGMSQFALSGFWGAYEFNTGDRFGNLGYFPLYLSLNPHNNSIFPKMQGNNMTSLTGPLVESNGSYTYSHTWTGDAGADYNTAICISKFGYFNNKNKCSEDIMLYFSGEPRYLGGLDDEPVLLGTTWQKDLHDHFFIDVNYANVQYFTSDANVIITDNIATFSPLDSNDTIYDLIITAQSINGPLLTASSDPFTLYAANCMDAYDCNDVNKPADCINYQCEYYDPINTYQPVPQGVDLSVFNEDVNISNQFPDKGETVTICADVSNHGTAYVYDVNVFFYLDDTNSVPIGSNTISVVPITYLDLPFRYETSCINWTVPSDINGPHRIWVEVDGNYPPGMTDEMLSNNYAVLDFFVNDPSMNSLDPALLNGCSAQGQSAISERLVSTQAESEACSTVYMRIPINVQVCENEIICGPVTGYELSYWNTIYWPSWSGYCQEFTAAGDALWAFIIAYEVSMGVFGGGAGSVLSLSDGLGILKTPYGWGAGNLPCHPAPTMFPYIKYAGVSNPGCGGMCPVSAWDCGQGYSFPRRFSSKYYNPYAYRLTGGARRVTRCHTETDYMEVPYQFCYPLDGSDPTINIPFNPFPGSPDPNDSSFGPTGPAPSGLGGGPPMKFWVGPPMAPDDSSAGFECVFSSTGTTTSTSTSDCIQCVPVLPYNQTRLQKGWNFFSLTTDPIDPNNDPVIPLQAGWNMFAYSGTEPFLWADACVSDTHETMTINDAHESGWLQSTIYYFDNTAQISKLVPGDDDSLRTNKAYWLYSDQNDLTLTLPGARGSAWTNYIEVNDINVIYGNQTMSLADAQTVGWLKSTIHYYDSNEANYKTIPGDDQYIYPWKGYWIYSNLDGPILSAPDLGAAAVIFNNRRKTFASGFYERKDIKATQTSIFHNFREKALANFTPGVAPNFGQNAPDFLLPDSKGQLTLLSNHKGRDLLLVFGTTSCPQCASKVTLLNEINTDSIKDGLKVIFVALGEDPHTIEEFIKENNVSFDVLVDTYGITGNQYGITKIPEAFIIDCEGVVTYATPHDGPSIWAW
ncbi:MAG: TlpA family protein disulfide reductase [Planctomycetota bacterium]|jgi:peroxiredoxin